MEEQPLSVTVRKKNWLFPSDELPLHPAEIFLTQWQVQNIENTILILEKMVRRKLKRHINGFASLLRTLMASDDFRQAYAEWISDNVKRLRIFADFKEKTAMTTFMKVAEIAHENLSSRDHKKQRLGIQAAPEILDRSEATQKISKQKVDMTAPFVVSPEDAEKILSAIKESRRFAEARAVQP